METVGWTVLDGRESSQDRQILDATGDTIINLKIGVRVGVGASEELRGRRHSFYLGYGRALSGHIWYEDIARFEYRMTF